MWIPVAVLNGKVDEQSDGVVNMEPRPFAA
jgi:hypothetical protein